MVSQTGSASVGMGRRQGVQRKPVFMGGWYIDALVGHRKPSVVTESPEWSQKAQYPLIFFNYFDVAHRECGSL